MSSRPGAHCRRSWRAQPTLRPPTGHHDFGAAVALSNLEIHGNRATLDGGGVESQASGDFTIDESNIFDNRAENGGGFANSGDGVMRISRTALWNNRAIVGDNDDSGLGGGIYSLGDAAAEYENVTISGNFAQVRGGGIYIDADAGVRIVNSTIAGNMAPAASAVGDEGTNLNLPIYPCTSVIFRNTVIVGNLGGPAYNSRMPMTGATAIWCATTPSLPTAKADLR